MHIVRLELLNWLRYARETAIDLSPEVYGIVATYDGDARRSNWAGKTGLIEAIRFALYGVHRGAFEDDWITDGEDSGVVRAIFSERSLVIERSRRRGHGTKLLVWVDGSESPASGKAAQALLDERLGLRAEDFEVTCWFGQKQLARLVLARPAERFALVSSWFSLGPLQRCAERARERLSLVLQEEKAVQLGFLRAEAVLGELCGAVPALSGVSLGDGREALLRELEGASARVLELELALGETEAELRSFSTVAKAVEARTAIVAIRKEGTELGALIKPSAPLTSEIDRAKTTVEMLAVSARMAGDDLKAKRTLAQGRFSGCCPVDGGACPVASEINGRVRQNESLLAEAQVEFDRVTVDRKTAQQGLEVLLREKEKNDRLIARRDFLRERVAELLPTSAPPGVAFDQASYDRLLSEARARGSVLEITRVRHESLVSTLVRFDALQKAVSSLEAERKRVWEKGQIARAALRVFGRQGAQRQIAEAALREIERGANALLSEAAVDLSLRIAWAAEGKGLAEWCAVCGAAFPASARVKECGACGEARGPKLIERLDVELSDRSGAAEDLAGAALQLSAAAWLRRERSSALSIAFLDEPFGALDEANRKSFAAHLAVMLRGASGFEQAFVVAHHPDVLDALPGRILVRAGSRSSTAEVV